MANVLGELFGDIANAIRGKNGETGSMKPAEFPAKISAIEAGTKDPKLLTASGEITPTTTDAVTITHNLCVIPDIVLVFMAALDESTTISASTLCVGGEVAYSAEAIADGATRYLYSIMGSYFEISCGLHESSESVGVDIDSFGCVREATPRTFKWGGSTQWPIQVGATYRWIAICGIKAHPTYLDVVCSLDGLGNLIVTGGVPEISQMEIYVDGTLAKTVDYVHGDSLTVGISDVAPELQQYTISVKAIGNLDGYPYQFFEPVTGWVLPKARGTCGDNVTWALDGDGVMTISGTGAMADYTYFEYYPWKDYQTEIVGLVVKDGVTHIGNYAFYRLGGAYGYPMTSLKSVKIADSVTSIGTEAFRGCTGIQTVDMGNGVVSVGQGVFNGCTNLTSLKLSPKLSTWGSSFAYQCTKLTHLVIPDGVATIGDRAFEGCTALSSVTIGNAVTSIGGGAFASCPIVEIVIPDSVVSIGNTAFRYNTALTTATIGSGVTSIGINAFGGCTAFTSATFKVTSGWWYASSSTATSGTDVTVTDTYNAAYYLYKSRANYYWFRS